MFVWARRGLGSRYTLITVPCTWCGSKDLLLEYLLHAQCESTTGRRIGDRSGEALITNFCIARITWVWTMGDEKDSVYYLPFYMAR